jgi:hypothetical protein
MSSKPTSGGYFRMARLAANSAVRDSGPRLQSREGPKRHQLRSTQVAATVRTTIRNVFFFVQKHSFLEISIWTWET